MGKKWCGDLKLLLTYSCVKMSRSTSKHSIFPSISCLMNDSVQRHTNFSREDVWSYTIFAIHPLIFFEITTNYFQLRLKEIVFCCINLSNLQCMKDFDAIIFLFSRSLQVWKMRMEWQFCHPRRSRQDYQFFKWDDSAKQTDF